MEVKLKKAQNPTQITPPYPIYFQLCNFQTNCLIVDILTYRPQGFSKKCDIILHIYQ